MTNIDLSIGSNKQIKFVCDKMTTHVDAIDLLQREND